MGLHRLYDHIKLCLPEYLVEEPLRHFQASSSHGESKVDCHNKLLQLSGSFWQVCQVTKQHDHQKPRIQAIRGVVLSPLTARFQRGKMMLEN